MTDQLTLTERMARASRAERLIEEVAEHFIALEARYHREWAIAKTTEQREAIWHKLNAVTGALADIKQTISDGAVARQIAEDGQ
jgi:hypothetical protein